MIDINLLPLAPHHCRDGQGRLCERMAEVRLYAPSDITPVPGSGMCRQHAAEVLAEYRSTLGEHWHTRPLETPEQWTRRVRWALAYRRSLMPTPPERQLTM